MTLDTFFKTFDQFADAPDAVAKMRELVLELAVQGKLVEPSSKPETDRAWLTFKKEISERIYGYDPGSPPPFDIPEHWEWCVLAEVADCRASAKVPPSGISDGDWVLDLEDIDGTHGKVIQFANFAQRRSLSTKAEFEAGDVLYSKLRPYLNKVVVAEKSGFCTTEIIPLRPASFHEPGFLRIYLRSLTFLNYAAQKNYGMKMPRLGTKDLESAKIPLPPPSEQKRIVAKVDELMALCDRLEAQQQERDEQASALARASLARFAEAPTPANLNLLFHKSYSIPPADLRKAILAMAVRGKLLPQNPKDEQASKLLDRIDLLKREAAAARRTRSTKNGDSPLRTTAPFEIPSTWIWTELSNLGHTSTGKTPPTGNSEYFSGNIPFVGPGQIRPSGEMIEAEKFISELGISSSTEAKPGDILMVCIGGSIGKAAIVRERLAFNQQLNLISPIEIETGYLFSVLNAEYFYDRVISSSSGSATPIINRSKWDSIPVPLPPLAEQRRIVAKVDQLMALVDQLETQLAASRDIAKNLLEALVAELTSSARAQSDR